MSNNSSKPSSPTSSPTTTLEDQKKINRVMSDPVIKQILSRVDRAGLNSKHMRNQIEMMAKANYSVDKIHTYMNEVITTAENQLRRITTGGSSGKPGPVPVGGGPSSPNNNNRDQITRDQYGNPTPIMPYFEVNPVIPVHGEIEQIMTMMLVLADRVSHDQSKPFSWPAQNVWDYVDECKDRLMYASPNLSEEEKKITEKRAKWMKNKIESKIKDELGGDAKKLTTEMYNKIIKSQEWKTPEAGGILTDEERNSLQLWEDIIHRLILEKINTFQKYGWINLVLQSNTTAARQLEEGSEEREALKKKDVIMMQKKMWVYVQLYMHVWNQKDQKSAYYFFLQMCLQT